MTFKPRSLKWRLGTLTVLALIASQILGLFFLLNDRQSAPTADSLNYNLRRMASALALLDASPPSLHGQVLKTASTNTSEYDVQDRPTVEKDNVDTDFRREKRKYFKERADTVFIQVEASPGQVEQFATLISNIASDLQNAIFNPALPQKQRAEKLSYAEISAQLTNGQWLNGTIYKRPSALPVWPILAQFFVTFLFIGLAIWAVVRRFTPPMCELTEAVRAFGRGETNAKLRERGPGEVVNAIRAFNEMQEKIWTSMRERTRMIAAMSHDLRSPITRLRLRAELIEDEENSQKILEICDEMNVLAQSTLSLAGEEFSQEPVRIVDIQTLVLAVSGDFVDMGHDVSAEEMEVSTMRCRPVGLKRAIRNVLENAVKYGERARISVYRRGEGLAIEIDDDGPGLPNGDLETVFKPFIRVPGERESGGKGSGLGLAISQAILRSHGGDIKLVNRKGGGLRATLSLPLNRGAAEHREEAKRAA